MLRTGGCRQQLFGREDQDCGHEQSAESAVQADQGAAGGLHFAARCPQPCRCNNKPRGLAGASQVLQRGGHQPLCEDFSKRFPRGVLHSAGVRIPLRHVLPREQQRHHNHAAGYSLPEAAGPARKSRGCAGLSNNRGDCEERRPLAKAGCASECNGGRRAASRLSQGGGRGLLECRVRYSDAISICRAVPLANPRSSLLQAFFGHDLQLSALPVGANPGEGHVAAGVSSSFRPH